jgi:hypothetical protein
MTKTLLQALAFAITSYACGATATPIYKCTDADGKTVFQQVPCNADPLSSLADTHTSETFRREQVERQARDQARADRDSRIKAIMATPAPASLPTVWKHEEDLKVEKAQIKSDEEAMAYLQICVDGDPDCSVSSVASQLHGMTMGAVEKILGAPREHSNGGTKLYYYMVSLRSGRYTYQVSYKVDRTRLAGGVGQIGNVVDEVNY